MKLNTAAQALLATRMLGILLLAGFAQGSPDNTSKLFPLNTNLPIVSVGREDGGGSGRNSQARSGPPIFSSSKDGGAARVPVRNQLNENELESYRRIAMGAQSFGLDMLVVLSNALQGMEMKVDVMISPFAMWSLLLLLAEGASGETLNQLRKTLYIEDHAALRRAYRDITAHLKANTTTIEVAAMQALFTDINQPVSRDYENTVLRDYEATLIPVDFSDVKNVYLDINEEVRKATRGLITHSVLPQDLDNAHLFIMSALFFKGQWKMPFDKKATQPSMFFDEEGQPLGQVPMMMKEANFSYAEIKELESFVLELPYGEEDRLSMVIVLPRVDVRLHKVIHNLRKFGVGPIFEKLKEASFGFEDELVELKMPKFDTETDLNMHSVLAEMGITDLFQSNLADLSKMAPNFFVSAIIHKTKIIVNEEGTIAAAVAGATLDNRTTPPKFHLNRPFIYLILEKRTNILLFAGHITNLGLRPNAKRS